MSKSLWDYNVEQLAALLQNAFEANDIDRFKAIVKVLVSKGDLQDSAGETIDDEDLATAFYMALMDSKLSDIDTAFYD